MESLKSKTRLREELKECIRDIKMIYEILDDDYKFTGESTEKLSYLVELFDPRDRLSDIFERIVEHHGDELK